MHVYAYVHACNTINRTSTIPEPHTNTSNFTMALKTQFLRLVVGILALLIAQFAHSLEKQNVTGDKLLVLFDRSSCVAVESLDGCPVSWKLPPVFALSYKNQVNRLSFLDPFLDQYKADAKCRNAVKKSRCAQIAPKCLPDGGKDFGEARTQCQNLFSTCPSTLTNTYKSQQYCEHLPTGKHGQAACVAPYVHISGACPQPKYKVRYIFKKRYHLLIELNIKVPTKRTFLFHIFVDKELKFRFLLLKLNIAPFNNSKISVKHDKSYATNSTSSEICIHTCDVNTFAKSLVVCCKQ